MKVTRKTDDQLIIERTPWIKGTAIIVFVLYAIWQGIDMIRNSETEFWSGVGVVVMAPAVGAMVFVAFIKRTQIILDRKSDTLSLRERTVTDYSALNYKLSDLAGVEIEKRYSTDDDGSDQITSRAVFVFDRGNTSGRRPLTSTFSSDSGAYVVATTVNEWLPATRLDSEAQ